jgi:hypothetical protein
MRQRNDGKPDERRKGFALSPEATKAPDLGIL